MYLCMYESMHVCRYVGMYAYIYIIYTWILIHWHWNIVFRVFRHTRSLCVRTRYIIHANLIQYIQMYAFKYVYTPYIYIHIRIYIYTYVYGVPMHIYSICTHFHRYYTCPCGCLRLRTSRHMGVVPEIERKECEGVQLCATMRYKRISRHVFLQVHTQKQ